MPSATQIRTLFRSAAQHLTEPHPFARSPVSMKPYPIQYKHLGVRVLRTSAVYVSLLSLTPNNILTIADSSPGTPLSSGGRLPQSTCSTGACDCLKESARSLS
jgi:hypothetical protein